MRNKYIELYYQFDKGRYGFMIDIAIFAIITYAFHLLFRYFAADIMSVPFILTSGNWLAHLVYLVSVWINQNILGMEIITRLDNSIWFTNKHGIVVNSSCSGLKQFYQVLVLFVLFPGPWKHKLWFIPLGFLAMFAANVFRIVVLSMIMSWQPEYFAFCHTWILRPLFYVILFGLWVWWVEKFKRRS